MKSLALIILVTGLSCTLYAQSASTATPEKWTTYNGKATFEKGSIYLVNTSKGGSALMWLNDTDFKNGIIELDLKGKDVRAESFLGVAFHALDNEHYDVIYFRPFNFKSPERKDHSVQYADAPDNGWEVLREKFPGKYENVVRPVPDPNDWFHAKIVVQYPRITVYVNNSKDPSLEVDQISKRTSGKLALWIDSKDGAFKNVVITK